MRSIATAMLVSMLSLAGVAAGLYGAEWYLGSVEFRSQKAGLIENAYDTRDRLQVVLDLRAAGVEGYPAVFPRAVLQTGSDGKLRSVIQIDGKELLPLGGISRRTTVTCNESGQFAIYQSDEHGFNNPLGLWRAAPVDIVAIGDSFTYGNCVPADKTIVAHLRRQYPTAVNLGLGGVGPLAALAVLREYGPELRPRRVLWFFYEGNDMDELTQERASDLLMGQLAGQPAQGLALRQVEIDRALMEFADARLADHTNRPSALGRFLKLSVLRERLRAIKFGGRESGSARKPADFALLHEVFERALVTVDSWNGRLAFVYLPGRDRYFGGSSPEAPNEMVRRAFLEIADKLGIPVIDLVPIFAADGSPPDLFVDANSHLNERGYELVAEAVLMQLDELQ